MAKPSRRRLQRILLSFAENRGLAGIEFAFLAPVLLMLTVCTIDLGIGFYDAMQVENAAQAGSEYAAVHGYNVTGISTVITSTTGLSGLSASPAPTEFCGCPSGTGITVATCGTTCSDSSMAGTYVTASATATYTTLVHYPTFPTTFTFANSATARIQ